ncbi:MAG: glycosyltransferase family 92 protein [Rickettsiaceae bacterium]|nr:glycosyltransferase family 92 protein [Rickettsiaceae bacterium]
MYISAIKKKRKKLRRKMVFYAFITLITLIITVKIYYSFSREYLLNYLGEFYFDEKYYIEHYPEIKSSNINPYKHYTTIGWVQDKNPNSNFDTKFFKNMYMLNHFNKHNLNPLAFFARSRLFFDKLMTKPSQVKKVEKLARPKNYLAIVAVFQNEARFMKEWIEFYKLNGVEKFYLYNHRSNDNFQEILDPYIKDGIVELRHEKQEPLNRKDWNRIQTKIYEAVAKETSNTTEWLLVLDLDEFLFPTFKTTLKEALSEYEEYAAVSAGWVLFGSNQIEKIPDHQLMIDTLTQFIDKDNPNVKTIVRPRCVESITHPHYPILKKGFAQVDENKEYFTGPFLPDKLARNLLRINHYVERDLSFYREEKLTRVHMKTSDHLDQDYKEKIIQELIQKSSLLPAENIDHTIQKYSNRLRIMMGFDENTQKDPKDE